MAGISADGRDYEVLAARRGILMRDDLDGTGGTGGDSITGMLVGLFVGLLLSLTINAALEGSAANRPWKVKVYRFRGPFRRRIHSEVLPSDAQDPEPRMRALMETYGLTPTE